MNAHCLAMFAKNFAIVIGSSCGAVIGLALIIAAIEAAVHWCERMEDRYGAWLPVTIMVTVICAVLAGFITFTQCVK